MQTFKQLDRRSDNVLHGEALAYERYREHFKPKAMPPVHWKWAAIAELLGAGGHGERGSLTFSLSGSPQGCELIPGLAINVQVVSAGSRTRAHAHSWWHLFFVRSGTALACLQDHQPREIAAGDLLLVPAWNDHSFINDASHDLVLLSMSNLPQQAAFGNHIAREPDMAMPPKVDNSWLEK